MSASPRRLRFFPLFVFGALGFPAIAGGALLLWRPEDISVSFVTTLLVAAPVASIWASLAGRRATSVLLAVSVFSILLVWPEVGLRVWGFRFDRTGVIQFGYPNPDRMIQLERDPDLFWKLPANSPGTNSLGYIGDDFEVPKPAGVYRMVFYGDSCTQQGFPAGVATMLSRLSSDPSRIEAINFGVGGYSSYQGKILAERWAHRLAADVGVIYFGWNDHWQAYGAVDSEKDPWGDRNLLVKAGESSRFVQWGLSLATPSRVEPLALPRVPIEDYRTNLETIGRRIDENGGRVLLVTAASAHIRRGAPDFLIERGFAANKTDVIELHRQYNDVVRELAGAKSWSLLDLEREAQEHPEFEAVFKKDGVHFTDEGLFWVSSRMTQMILAEFIGQ